MLRKILNSLWFILFVVCVKMAPLEARIQSLQPEEDEHGPSLVLTGIDKKKEEANKEASSGGEKTVASSEKESAEKIELPSLSEITDKIMTIDWLSWFAKLMRIIIVLICARMLWKVLKIAIETHLNKIISFHKKRSHKEEVSPLLKTIIPIIESVVRWILSAVTILVILSGLDVDITPIVLSFSVVGVAISFGSQELVKDLINGILTLFDGNIAVGDFVKIGSHTGIVESMSLRAIVLRHLSGEIQTIPFSEAKVIINCSRDFNIIEPCVTVDPHVSLADIAQAFANTFNSMQKHPAFHKYIKGELSDIGIKSITANGVVVVAALKIKPDPEKEFLVTFQKYLLEHCQQLNISFRFNPNLPDLSMLSAQGDEDA